MMSTDSASPEDVARYKELFGFRDWDIVVSLSDDPDSEDSGRCFTDPQYQRARIILYPEVILRKAKEYPSETLKAVMFHEFSEVLVSEFSLILTKKQRETPAFTEFCDALADKIGRLLLTLDNQTSNT